MKYSKNQSFSSASDSSYDECHWLKQFEDKLLKTSVQSKSNDVYDQITSIMNSKSKYSSVQEAVSEMMNRSGLNDYLNKNKIAEAQDSSSSSKSPELQTKEYKMPLVIQMHPDILNTLENIITDSKGNKSVPTILNKLHSLHAKDVGDEAAWEDDKLIRLISKMNLEAKTNNPGSYENFSGLGKQDNSIADLDTSNSDAFSGLMPAKM
jgi:hypothetical protein